MTIPNASPQPEKNHTTDCHPTVATCFSIDPQRRLGLGPLLPSPIRFFPKNGESFKCRFKGRLYRITTFVFRLFEIQK